MPYDTLSINIGSTPRLDAVAGAAEHVVPVKPIRHFNERWLALISTADRHAVASRGDLYARGDLRWRVCVCGRSSATTC